MRWLERPSHLAPGELDCYLERGWFRIGQSLITCKAMMVHDHVRSTVWTRTELDQFQFKKNLRRAMRRVEQRFRVIVRPLVLDEEHEQLYQRYLTVTSGSRASSLQRFLWGDELDRGLFNSWEVSIFDGEALVAFSWFDQDRESLQSLIGVYEPTLAEYGLGFYTLLREVQFGIETGRSYFYAGYILSGDPMMDYKLRTGAISFLDDRSGVWRPWKEFSPFYYIPAVERLRAALMELQRRLEKRHVQVRLLTYELFEVPMHSPGLEMCLDQPLVLDCFPELHPIASLLVSWSIEEETFQLIHALRTTAHKQNHPEEIVELLIVVEQQELGADLHQVVDAVLLAGEYARNA